MKPAFQYTGDRIKHAFEGILHLIYPHLCAGCGNDLPGREQLICLSCLDKLPVTDFHLYADNPVEKIFWGRLPLVTAFAYLFFTKDSILQNLLHQFKYKGDTGIGLYFGRRIGEGLQQSNRHHDIEALIPLPLFYKKERQRGYNQATVLCNGISESTGIPVITDAIHRQTFTETQTHKNRVERWQNIENKFSLNRSGEVNHKHVLLVDDVLTTGATLEACGTELLKAEGLRLSIAALAYTCL